MKLPLTCACTHYYIKRNKVRVPTLVVSAPFLIYLAKKRIVVYRTS